MKPTMKFSILAILVLLTQACATAHFTRPCFIHPSAEKNPLTVREHDYNVCRAQSITEQQMYGCMGLRGYQTAECDTMTGEFVRY